MAEGRVDQSPGSASGEHLLTGTLAGRETLAPQNFPNPHESLLDEAPSSTARMGRYELLGILGQGAMGIVYLARDAEHQRQVALKLPKFCSTSSADNTELLQRFYREALIGWRPDRDRSSNLIRFETERRRPAHAW